MTPYEFQLLAEGYQVRRKEREFLVGWQTALLMNMWRGEKSKVIEVSDLLPWVKDEMEKAKGAVSAKNRIEQEASFDYTVKSYAKTAGIDTENLSPEEHAELALKAVNLAVGSKMFGRVPKGWEVPDG